MNICPDFVLDLMPRAIAGKNAVFQFIESDIDIQERAPNVIQSRDCLVSENLISHCAQFIFLFFNQFIFCDSLHFPLSIVFD